MSYRSIISCQPIRELAHSIRGPNGLRDPEEVIDHFGSKAREELERWPVPVLAAGAIERDGRDVRIVLLSNDGKDIAKRGRIRGERMIQSEESGNLFCRRAHRKS